MLFTQPIPLEQVFSQKYFVFSKICWGFVVFLVKNIEFLLKSGVFGGKCWFLVKNIEFFILPKY